MTPPLVNDPEHWRTRAQVMRHLAGQAEDKNTREIMLRIAHDLDLLAARAQARAESG
jgi:hypothetical protein